jgi:starch phosphorylase
VLWQQCDHNPIAMLQQIDVDRLESRAAQMALHGRINHAYRRLQEYLKSRHTWGARHASVLGARPVAYFSAEFGLHESMPIYSGGLGILAGDHLKSASDLGIPLVGIGLVLRPGLLPATPRSRRLAARGIHRRGQSSCCPDAAGHARQDFP